MVRPGPFAIVADLGRPGYGHLGVPRSGAADPDSLRLANRLVGNPEDAAVVELTLGGATLRFAGRAGSAPAWVAVTGAAASVRLGPGPAPGPGQAAGARLADDSGLGVPFAVPNGATLTVGTPATAVRSYLAVRGGVTVAPVLGSRSADTLSGIGPSPLRAGDRLPVGGTAACGPIVADVAPRAAGRLGLPARPWRARSLTVSPSRPSSGWWPVRGTTGSTPAAMEPAARRRVRGDRDSNRSGLRLSGPEPAPGPPGRAAERGHAARARCRCRPAASPSCSWPIIRSPAATRSSPSWPRTTSAGPPSCAPGTRSGSGWSRGRFVVRRSPRVRVTFLRKQ